MFVHILFIVRDERMEYFRLLIAFWISKDWDQAVVVSATWIEVGRREAR